MRRALDTLYDACAWLAAACMVAVLASVLLQVLGGVFGFYLRGTDAYAGYFMAALSFLALAHTLKRGEHIRVTLVIQRLPGRPRRWMELLCLAVAALLSGLFAWYAWKMVWWSWAYNDVSMAEDMTPLWIPQSTMALGVSVLFVAFLDDLVQALAGRLPAHPPPSGSGEPSRIE